jgi:PAS domain S-box-containing protein
VLVAPIVADATGWGVVAVAHRRGALFPEDDLEVLADMARNAATALDHHRLIADRRRQERREAEARLREIETRVDLMLDSIKDYAMLMLEADGRIAAWHLGAEHVFGHRRSAIAGQSAAPIYEMSPAEFSSWLQEARLHGRAEREGPCRRADGSTFTGSTMIRPLVEETDGTPGFVVVTQDVTDRRDLEERLRQGQKMEAIGQLAGGVAHDFNNLLTAILGYSDWLDRELTGDPRRGQVTEIQKAAERAADLTRQLLAFSRRQQLRPAALDLSALARELVPMLRRIIDEQVEIVATLPQGLPAIMADRSQIEQIILNLAVNARDAMPEGGRLTIGVGETWLEEGDPVVSGGFPSGPYALLEVADTGTGMSDETRRRVFEPFFTTKEVGHGTGLGLSTVYGIVKQMGGAIDLESELGRGTTFRLYFPQAALAVEDRPVEVPMVSAPGRKTVLVVEDDAEVRMSVARLLEEQGYRVIAAEHAHAALALTGATDTHIDLVIADMVMPDSTGPELVRLLGEQQPHVSALFISGREPGVSGRNGGNVAGESLLERPFSSNELLTRVRRILSAA